MLSTRHILWASAALLVVCWAQDAHEEPSGDFRSFRNCTWAKGDPGAHASARLEGCGDSDVCPLYRNTEAKLEIQFRVPNATKGVFRRIYGLFEKVMVPYGREVNICNSTASVDDDVKCTQGGRGLREGHLYQHTGAFFVKPFFPKVKVDVAVYVYDKEGLNKLPIACVLIPVEIRSRASSSKRKEPPPPPTTAQRPRTTMVTATVTGAPTAATTGPERGDAEATTD